MPSNLSHLLLILAEVLVFLIPIVLVGLWLTDNRETAFFAFVAVVVSLVISYALGLVYSHPAPYMTTSTLVTGSPENSFPSQHTTVLFAMVWPLALRRRRWLAGVFLIAGVLTGIARIYVGFHYPIDIIGGIVVSVIGAGIVAVSDEYVATIGQWFIAVDTRIREQVNDWV
jgi:undecaprenyl-diphosphatase